MRLPFSLPRLVRALPDPALDAILSRVSRSFYLSLAVLPGAVRAPISLGYLLARAADTVADTEAVARERRLELLRGLREAVVATASGEREGPDRFARALVVELTGPVAVAEERALLEQLGACLERFAALADADRQAVANVVVALATGMERDLCRFDGVELRALASLDELDEHCYFAAGCVGEFWTRITAWHIGAVRHLADPALVERGVRLGKALQLVNVLRDVPGDLAQGRCYLPAPLLMAHGLRPADLRDPTRRRKARPVLAVLVEQALEHLEAARAYVRASPSTAPRLRLACVWPLWIGLATLSLLVELDDPLAPEAVRKITRKELYRIVAESSGAVWIDRLLDELEERKVARLRRGTSGWRRA